MISQENVKRFAKFIKARHEVYLARAAGKKKPWTKDEILQQYRFCNVYRELDTVTVWIAENWRSSYKDNPNVWFAMAVARFINWPGTLAEFDPLPWNPEKVLAAINKRKDAGDKVWTGAYMIGTQGNARDKPSFVVYEVLDKLWGNRIQVRPREGDTLASFAHRLQSQYAFKGFMTGQVVADAKYVDPHLLKAADWHTWAVSGPGSRRGMARLQGATFDPAAGEGWRPPTNERAWHAALIDLRERTIKLLPANWEPLHAQDIQNCLCEFDKYERVRLGQGKPRSLYPGVK